MKSRIALWLAFGLALSGHVSAQVTSGKVVYERKTNLYKKFSEEAWVQDYVKEIDKIKVDVFELYFNDSQSVFRPQESDLKENFSWMTDKNTVYQDFNKQTRYTLKSLWGDQIPIQDTLYRRSWKITDSKRTICGYNCRKAIWQPNDSTRIYAWYCDEIMASTGPESFYGLPGMILGLATENGGVIYFAKSVDVLKPEAALFIPEKTKSKVYAPAELRTELEKNYGKEKWGKAMIKDFFGYW
jgi:GLPGLI family protein